MAKAKPGKGAFLIYDDGCGDALAVSAGRIVIDFSAKSGSIYSYSAHGPRSHGPAWVDAGDGDRVSYGAEVSDSTYAQAREVVILGGSGDDELWGGAVKNTLSGGAGRDRLFGADGADTLDGGAGDDVLYGDWYWFGGGADTLRGGDGRDLIFGEGGHDRLDGGAGDDRLDGGAGDDRIVGGGGIDTAVFSGSRADYVLSRSKGGDWTVRDLRPGMDGADVLSGVERLSFADGELELAGRHRWAPLSPEHESVPSGDWYV